MALTIHTRLKNSTAEIPHREYFATKHFLRENEYLIFAGKSLKFIIHVR